ncbi:MAG: STAS domain-containing protein [Acidobacteriota bacterium]|nr:MAG: STAS domain-containing protein [Acidobacteriota bacterium]
MTRRKLEISVENRDEGALVYALSGDLHGSAEAYGLQEEVRGRIAKGTRKVVIDLAHVRRIDSSGIGILVAMMWSASRAGGRLILSAVPDPAERLLSIAMLLDHIEHTDTVGAALARLAEG